jgi:hypothetical protein
MEDTAWLVDLTGQHNFHTGCACASSSYVTMHWSNSLAPLGVPVTTVKRYTALLRADSQQPCACSV